MIYLIFPLIFIVQSLQCIISGKESGYCAYNPLSPQSFCASQISSYVCVPAHNVTIILSRKLGQSTMPPIRTRQWKQSSCSSSSSN